MVKGVYLFAKVDQLIPLAKFLGIGNKTNMTK